MIINRLRIENYKAFEENTISFERDLTVIAAPNGCGKTSLLDAIATPLSWLRARVMNDKGNGSSIDEKHIRNGSFSSILEVETSYGNWRIAKKRKARNEDIKSDLSILKEAVYSLRERLENDESLPILAYYSVNRAVNDIPLRIRTRHDFSPISIYEDTLKGSSNFRLFFEWFREREDLENENRRYKDALIQPEGFVFPDPQLTAVRRALEAFLPEYNDFAIRRNPLRMSVKKNGFELNIDTLSAGESSFIALIGDIARRLAIANPRIENPLNGSGIILIDEIDLHLHPAWQRRAIANLTMVFPQVQFVVTTHSPQVLSEVAPRHVRLLSMVDNKIDLSTVSQTIGLNSVQILKEIMGDTGIKADIESKISEIAKLIDQDDFRAAKQQIAELKDACSGDIPAVIEAESTIHMLEPEGEDEA